MPATYRHAFQHTNAFCLYILPSLGFSSLSFLAQNRSGRQREGRSTEEAVVHQKWNGRVSRQSSRACIFEVHTSRRRGHEERPLSREHRSTSVAPATLRSRKTRVRLIARVTDSGYDYDYRWYANRLLHCCSEKGHM